MTAVLAPDAPPAPPAVEDLDERSAISVATSVGGFVFDALSGRRTVSDIGTCVSSRVARLLLTTRLDAARGPDHRVRSVHACPITEFAVEACMVVGTNDRVRALVLRIERGGGRWVCTRLSLL
ncbi:Rv3235 family protein [Saccharopolyspora oryzae]|uniref:Rv3235 family protein n=1 Tax=Saccharopolyspora oryzae TaxID=2997343 RepID=A0ABT4V8N0_9PSEU|nr:Rv3235 family protein [Saccharopolyspora oryzae]MDA3630321.1 Rv3235 family protein [Saccharopolyspora oryzae]